MGDEHPRGTTDDALCHWHDEEISAMKEKAADLDSAVKLLSDRLPDHFAATFAVLVADVGNMKKALDTQFVSKAEFDPVRRLVYGLAGILLMGVGGAIVRLVIR